MCAIAPRSHCRIVQAARCIVRRRRCGVKQCEMGTQGALGYSRGTQGVLGYARGTQGVLQYYDRSCGCDALRLCRAGRVGAGHAGYSRVTPGRFCRAVASFASGTRRVPNAMQQAAYSARPAACEIRRAALSAAAAAERQLPLPQRSQGHRAGGRRRHCASTAPDRAVERSSGPGAYCWYRRVQATSG